VCRLTISGGDHGDLGLYTCEARNALGSDKTTARLQTGGCLLVVVYLFTSVNNLTVPPARPGRPDVLLSSDSELFMTWEAPEGVTTLEGLTYRLEYRLQSEWKGSMVMRPKLGRSMFMKRSLGL